MQFDFGNNWKEFSENALSEQHLLQAKNALMQLLQPLDIQEKTFIDIGFGQGLGLLNATEIGADTVGADINPTCKKVLENNQKLFPKIASKAIPVVVGSILEDEVLQKIQQIKPKFDVVHSWGVLHHTGNMEKAILNSMKLVQEKGYFIIAIYNRHWSSLAWLGIKWLYNILPKFLQKAMIYVFFPIIYLAKFAVTGKNPLKKDRGMNFFYDVIDWVGGYPYEYASVTEMQDFFKKQGFSCIKVVKAEVPTGCNEFIFQKN